MKQIDGYLRHLSDRLMNGGEKNNIILTAKKLAIPPKGLNCQLF